MLRPREIKKEMRKKMLRLFFRLGVLFIPKYYFAFLPSSYGHTTVKAPYPIRTAKLSTVGPDQYYGRGLRGNLRCCMSFFFFANLFFFQKRLRLQENLRDWAYSARKATPCNHTFSAFWLRSSVVSVLISLISGTWRMASHEFK